MTIKTVLALAAAAALAAAVILYSRKKPSGEDPALLEGIRRNCRLYEGLYEGLYQCVVRQELCSCDAYLEWQNRTGNLTGEEDYKAAFFREFPVEEGTAAQLRPRMEKLLLCIQKAGILRAEEQSHTVKEVTSKKYTYLYGQIPPAGTVCKVMKPCWVHGDDVVEQGILIGEDG